MVNIGAKTHFLTSDIGQDRLVRYQDFLVRQHQWQPMRLLSIAKHHAISHKVHSGLPLLDDLLYFLTGVPRMGDSSIQADPQGTQSTAGSSKHGKKQSEESRIKKKRKSCIERVARILGDTGVYACGNN